MKDLFEFVPFVPVVYNCHHQNIYVFLLPMSIMYIKQA